MSLMFGIVFCLISLAGAMVAYETTSCIMGQMRRADDPYNHVAAGLVSSIILTHKSM